MITCVTAPSRSGTSLTMQMLLNAGIPIAWNCLPNRTQYNPRGHYEMDWRKGSLAECEGKAVKLMPFDLHILTPDHDYQFITIIRDVASIDASQAHTVQWRGAEMSDAHETEHWHKYTLEYIARYPHVIVQFDELFTGVGQGKIGAFLDMTPLQIAKMCDCVDQSLRHFKGGVNVEAK